MDESIRRCEHSRLFRIEYENASIAMFGNIFQCEDCKALVEVVIGRTITAQQLRDFASALESGKAKPSIAPPPASVEVTDDDTWSRDGRK